MKTKKRSKILSLLLALSMLVGMVPLSVIPAMAADGSDGTAATDPPVIKSRWRYKENPTWLKVSNSGGSRSGITRLKNLMEDRGGGAAVYIKLTSDLVYTGDKDFNLTMKVVGCKHLDLNGHKLIYGVDPDRPSTFITVTENAELHIYDSQNGGGYIHYEGKLTDSISVLERSLIKVEEGGALFVNGGELEAGRSKEIYGEWEEDSLSGDDLFCGNIVHLISGTAVDVSPGGACVINGGEFYGRERYETAVKSSERLVINDGFFKGFSGARGLYTNILLNNETGVTYLNGGDYDTHKNKRIKDGYSEFYYGFYGKAIENQRFESPDDVTFNPLADVVISGSGGKQRQTAKVTPQADSFSLEYPGWDTFNPASAAPRYVYIPLADF